MFLAKTLVEYRQGPSVIMTRDQPKLAGDIAPARLLLEYLAVLETFGESARFNRLVATVMAK